MIKIKNIKRISNEILEYQLENNDKILLFDSEIREMEETHEPSTFESIEENKYCAVLSDVEYSDDIAEIIGFELI